MNKLNILITMLFKYSIVIFLVLISVSLKAQDSTKKTVYHFKIMQEIGPAAWRQTQKAFEEAEKLNASFILLHMNTYGGLVDAADSIRTKIINSKIPVIAFIDNNAASAGALISIACDSIYMRTGANIGAATVVTQDGSAAPDKYQAYMRATMRSTAESHGKKTFISNGDTIEIWHRDPKIAEAMVDPSIFIPNIIDSGKVLTFTASEAIAHHYCEGMAENIDEVLEKMNASHYEIKEYKPSFLEKIIDFLINPVVQGLLIMLIIGGIYFELQTPGIGFPLAAAVTGAIFYFAPLYLEGLAENWELLLFIGGLILIGIEIFVVPGFGVTGISGIVLVVLGLVLSMIDNVVFELDGQWAPVLIRALAVVVVSSFISLIGSVWIGSKLFTSKMFPHMALHSVQEKSQGFVGVDFSYAQLIGEKGLANTTLRPSGKIDINGEIFDAVAETGFIQKGENIMVTKFETGQLYVRKSN